LCLFFGYGNLPVAEAFKNQLIVVEPSIGYASMFAPIQIFETYSHMHAMYGAAKRNVPLDTSFVVYPGFKRSDFIYKPQKQNYVLFLGRITSFKGANIAYDICNTNKQEAIFAGPNILGLKDTKYCKMIGFVEPKQRSELLANAKCLFAPSCFLEPTNWGIIEAQFSGTPTLSTDFGGPTETVKNGITGFRTNQTKNFIKLLNRISEINPKDCLDNAIANFSIEKQMNNYEDIFVSLIS
jgi:glycosyltransferase involved in cell wall biosynthesis